MGPWGRLSLKSRLAAGAAVLASGTLLTALILFLGMTQVAVRLEAALAVETRMARYSTLSTQVSTFFLIATEAVQRGLPADERAERIAPIAARISGTFELLRTDLEPAVRAAEASGVDMQSRYATQSIGIARMEALLSRTLEGLTERTTDRDVLRAHIDTFASGFDPLLAQAVNQESLFRREMLDGIDSLRRTLSRLGVFTGIAAVALTLAFYFGLVRPQFQRLDRLGQAAQRIGRADFAIALPETRGDEIGQLYSETNRMAAALAARQAEVAREWGRLNDTIAERTEALRDANVRLEKVDETRRRFFADISHELRTPLTVILMEAQIGRRGGPDPAGAFATIEQRAARLNRRIDDLLRIARSDSGALALQSETLLLDRVAADVVEEVAAECENAGLTLDAARVPPVAVTGDPNWVRQVLAGLVRNAVRHARNGGRVRIVPLEGEEMAGLAVIDDGPGIAGEARARVFDRFAQAGEATAQGFGLGLPLARWVVEAQGGVLALDSPVPTDEALGRNPGTKVSVRLPRAPE